MSGSAGCVDARSLLGVYLITVLRATLRVALKSTFARGCCSYSQVFAAGRQTLSNARYVRGAHVSFFVWRSVAPFSQGKWLCGRGARRDHRTKPAVRCLTTDVVIYRGGYRWSLPVTY